MKQDAKNIIQAQLQHIPAKVREALLKVGSSSYVKTLSQKNNLRTDQAGVLEDELMIVLLGLESPQTFMNNLMQRGRIPKEIAATIVRDINTDVFSTIRHELAEFYKTSWDRYEGSTENTTKNTPPRTQVQSTIYPQQDAQQQQPRINPPPNLPTGQTSTASSDSFVREKMEGAFRTPPETTRIVETPPTHAPQQSEKPSLEKRYSGVDPYREPVK